MKGRHVCSAKSVVMPAGFLPSFDSMQKPRGAEDVSRRRQKVWWQAECQRGAKRQWRQRQAAL